MKAVVKDVDWYYTTQYVHENYSVDSEVNNVHGLEVHLLRVIYIR
jgi:hypothetical protein